MQENSVVFDQVARRAQMVISKVRDSLAELLQRVDQDFIDCVRYLASHEGTVIFTGVGKSASVARKLSVTFASLGMPAFFVHPTEMGHGDLGNVSNRDVLIALSHSGETSELLEILPVAKRRAKRLISLVGNPRSSLAKMADFCLSTGIVEEGCHLGLAPTTSTTVSLVMGDALAVCVAEARQVSREDFAKSHPSGRLGQMTTLCVGDVMCPIADCSVVSVDDDVQSSIIKMAMCRQPVSLVDRDGRIVGLQPIALAKQAQILSRDLTSVTNAQYVSPLAITLTDDLSVHEALSLVNLSHDQYFVVFNQSNAVGLFDASSWR